MSNHVMRFRRLAVATTYNDHSATLKIRAETGSALALLMRSATGVIAVVMQFSYGEFKVSFVLFLTCCSLIQ